MQSQTDADARRSTNAADVDGKPVAGYQLDYVTSSKLPTPWATFAIHVFVDPGTGKEHLALTLGDVGSGAPVLARVHSECLTGDALFSQRCDCGAQLEASMRAIAEEGRGAILYLRQEGRGIGLVNKIRAYNLQDAGADTVEANERLGFPADMRRYDLCKPMLDHFGIFSLRLMTNNPRKVRALERLGLRVEERLPLQVNRNAHNEAYLSTKAVKLGHWLKGGQ
ncbi:GTP cyclohydrolase II [Parapusillimonas granuli]|uniref:GTP cyclohydrolase-2 n=1 Tax=Parapusillimonas granuli TaxID=380911 RepID=A0A853FZS9_9BURK|nr:GTP cyclohydrolase II [Parapusillimonas granuli]MBB5217134.1 GTP cyclohydrolase II [Parapusillimonas granuli]MEB2401599.1 GTP cyclohydrolase II [Alcaligenaceae bacterium]NYT50103.1 GTP cyclohydrolase II [Parapusillimonas granuli]